MRPWFRPASRLRGPRSCHDVPMTTTASPGAPPGTRRGPGAPPRPPLRRPLRVGAPGPGWATRPGRLIAGVAAGLADHLGLPVIRVRVILVAVSVLRTASRRRRRGFLRRLRDRRAERHSDQRSPRKIGRASCRERV